MIQFDEKMIQLDGSTTNYQVIQAVTFSSTEGRCLPLKRSRLHHPPKKKVIKN